MSQENVLNFVRKVPEDPGLLAKLRPLTEDDMTGLLKVAAEAGFDFNAEDYRVAMQANSIASASDLSDNDLDVIAGGGIASATGGAAASISLHNVGILVTITCNPSGGGPKY